MGVRGRTDPGGPGNKIMEDRPYREGSPTSLGYPCPVSGGTGEKRVRKTFSISVGEGILGGDRLSNVVVCAKI